MVNPLFLACLPADMIRTVMHSNQQLQRRQDLVDGALHGKTRVGSVNAL